MGDMADWVNDDSPWDGMWYSPEERKNMAKKRRIASISLATKTDDGYEYDQHGVLLGDPDYPGSASALIEVDHPTRKDDNGYPIRGRLVVGKFQFPLEEGETEVEEAFIDYTESYLNLTFWEPVQKSPKAK